MSRIHKGSRLYRVDYHISNESYIVRKYNKKTGMGEIESIKNPGTIYIFNNVTLRLNTLYSSPKEALDNYIRISY